MIQETTITIGGQNVCLRYCAAAETGFERLTGKKIDIFSWTPVEFDVDGKPTKYDPPTAIMEDYQMLALAAVVAAYARIKKDAPIDTNYILYEASPIEIIDLVKAVTTLRAKWYEVPEVVKPDIKDTKGKKSKNAQPPTTSTKK